MTQFILKAVLKNKGGTGISRRLRKIGKIPAIIYGKNSKSLQIILDHDKIFHATEYQSFYKKNIVIAINENYKNVKIKALQKHPFKPKILHADFMLV